MVKEKIHFKKEEITGLIKSCQALVSWLTQVDLPKNIRYQQLNNAVNIITTFECLLAFLYAEVYKYGNIKDVINTQSEVLAKYTLAASLVFSEPRGLTDTLEKLPIAWEKVTSMLDLTGLTIDKRPDSINKCISVITDTVKLLGIK